MSGSVRAPEAQIRVFISYSRKDAAVAEQLLQQLEQQREFDAYLDKHDILPGEAWQDRLSKLIEAADTVVILTSPDSVTSPVCDWEMNEAERLGKRLLPVVVRDAEPDKVPGRLKRLNYIFMRDAAEASEALGKLRTALLTDIGWIREHTRLGELAQDWHAHKRPDERLQRGSALIAAELWLTSRPREAPEATSLQRDYIQESRRIEQAAMAKERGRLMAMQRWLGAAVALLMVSIAGLIGWVNQGFLMERYHWHVEMKPSVLTALQQQELHAKPGAKFEECATGCPTMVVVPAGNFMMGDNSHKVTAPRRKVTIAEPLAISKTEVSFAHWNACTRAGACPRITDSKLGKDDHPVIGISWDLAKQYVGWLARVSAQPYRLLSEAEFEYAARGVLDAGLPHPQYPWGNEIGTGNANCLKCGSAWDGASTAPVGAFKPNAFGLHNMHGNVWQWVEDAWHHSYHGAPSDGTAWTKDGWRNLRVSRGGSFRDPPENLQTGVRNGNPGSYRNVTYGIRVARSLPARASP